MTLSFDLLHGEIVHDYLAGDRRGARPGRRRLTRTATTMENRRGAR